MSSSLNSYNAVDETFYDAIKLDFSEKCIIIEIINKGLI